MSDVGFVVKLRDAAQMIADACEEYLEKQAPVNKASWDPSQIKWQRAQGTKGSYERYPAEGQKAESTQDYHNLLADLKSHDGKLSRDGFFYWLFEDSATVGRKKRK